MACLTSAVSTGTIARANLSWALTDTNVAGSTTLTGSAVDTNLAVAYQDLTTVVPKILYWNIVIPATGVGGSCTGTVTVATLAA